MRSLISLFWIVQKKTKGMDWSLNLSKQCDVKLYEYERQLRVWYEMDLIWPANNVSLDYFISIHAVVVIG